MTGLIMAADAVVLRSPSYRWLAINDTATATAIGRRTGCEGLAALMRQGSKLHVLERRGLIAPCVTATSAGTTRIVATRNGRYGGDCLRAVRFGDAAAVAALARHLDSALGARESSDIARARARQARRTHRQMAALAQALEANGAFA